MILQLITARLQ